MYVCIYIHIYVCDELVMNLMKSPEVTKVRPLLCLYALNTHDILEYSYL